MTHGGRRQGAGRPKGSGKFSTPTKAMRVPEHMVRLIEGFIDDDGQQVLLYSNKVSAGFPSPADDHMDTKLNLHDLLIDHPAATFFLRVEGDSMINAGIHDGDLLIVDRSLEPAHGKIVIAAMDGELTVKRLLIQSDRILLQPENNNYPPIEISSFSDLNIWGVVKHVVHHV